MTQDTYQLAIRIGRREQLRIPISIESLQSIAAKLARALHGVVWEEPTAILVVMPDGITHIVARFPAGAAFTTMENAS